jgi:hypothetical protein
MGPVAAAVACDPSGGLSQLRFEKASLIFLLQAGGLVLCAGAVAAASVENTAATSLDSLEPRLLFAESGEGIALAGDRSKAIDCLAQAIGHEAANEPESGRQAVAQVILNRVRHRAFPNTVCGVVFQGSLRRTGCQFTFTCDGSLNRALSRRTWADALRIAGQAMEGQLPPTIGAATHYHADYVAPRWAPAMMRVSKIGAHIFYQFPGRAADDGGQFAVGVGAPEPGPSGRLHPYAFTPWGLTPAVSSAAN